MLSQRTFFEFPQNSQKKNFLEEKSLRNLACSSLEASSFFGWSFIKSGFGMILIYPEGPDFKAEI